MATEIGALIIDLRANSAQFTAEMDGARKSLEGVGTAGKESSRGIAQFAAKAIETLIPGLQITSRELSTMIRLATTATGVLGGLAQAGLIVGAAGVGYAAGNALANFRDLIRAGYGVADAFKLAVGATKSWEEAQKKAGEEQTAFIETLARTRGALIASQTALAAAQGKNVSLGLKAGGDDSGSATADLQAALRAAELAGKARANEIVQMKISAEARKQLEIDNIATVRTLRQNAYLEDAIAQKKIAQDAAAAQLKIWQDETGLLIAEFGKRVKMRQDFETGLGQGGLGGGTTVTGLGQVGELSRKVEKETKDLAGARRLGLVTDKEYFDTLTQIQARAFDEAQQLYDTWAAFPAVERAVTQAVEKMSTGWGTLGDAMASASTWAAQFVPTTDELVARQGALVDQFGKIPAAAGSAGPAVQKLANDYNELAWQAAGATQQIYSAAQAMIYFHSVGG